MGGFFAVCLSIPHLGIIISTGVYRFRNVGLICSMSNYPTSLTDANEDPTDTWTMKKDGELIIALWIMQVIFCCCTCLAGGIKPLIPTATQVEKLNDNSKVSDCTEPKP